ncbi:hypothetical protein V5O48_006521 [Marasmius crinis-equi]|uniref:AMP-dependent synthetase/ligase domain-containing protein n=1 Tax=Marasmius crinis-equi TaxID=585013 RepID=A0ABR3FJH5_9AGAR
MPMFRTPFTNLRRSIEQWLNTTSFKVPIVGEFKSTKPQTAFRTPLTNLKRAVEHWPSATAFKLPIVDANSNHISGYDAITFQEFYNDVEYMASYWYTKLSDSQVPPGSVVGLCLRGHEYIDLLHIYGIMRAGYVPQMFIVEVLDAMLKSSDARALVYHEEYSSRVKSSTNTLLQAFPSAAISDLKESQIPIPQRESEHRGDDIAMIFHTSGSTSGLPKHVPWKYRFLDAIMAKAPFFCVPRSESAVQDVDCCWGTVLHVAAFSLILSSVHHGSCVIMQSTADLSIAEFKSMMTLGGLTRAMLVPVAVSKVIRECRHNFELLNSIQTLDPIMFGGASLPQDELDFARGNSIKLVNLYGCTESGNMMLSKENPNYLSPIQTGNNDTQYQFLPVEDHSSERLKELVVLPESGDCPPKPFSDEDGIFYTGDLWEEITPGQYLHRGRRDDWIKMSNELKCDAGFIEAEAKKACAGLFSEGIVVGSGYPSPVLVVEVDCDSARHAVLREEIYHRISRSEGYQHETVASPESVIIVPTGSLSRTKAKGNIRRKVVEAEMKEELDSIFGEFL